MREEKITIITVCYNAEHTIENTIRSVLNQSYSNLEYIIVDGLSNDNTIEIINSYRTKFINKKIPFVIISEKDMGIYDAMNKGIEAAQGQWILFMNSDDKIADSSVLLKVFSKDNSGIDVIYGDSIQYDEKKKYPIKAKPIEMLPKRMPFMHQAVFVRSNLCKRYKFDLSYKLCSDYDFFFKLYSEGVNFKRIDLTICYYYIGGVSGNNQLKALKEVIAIKKKHKDKYAITWIDEILWVLEAIKFCVKKAIPVRLIENYRRYTRHHT